MSWKEIFERKQHKPSAGEDLADSIALMLICALLVAVVFM